MPGNQATIDDILAARQSGGYSGATMGPVGAGNTMTTQHFKQPGPAEAALSSVAGSARRVGSDSVGDVFQGAADSMSRSMYPDRMREAAMSALQGDSLPVANVPPLQENPNFQYEQPA